MENVFRKAEIVEGMAAKTGMSKNQSAVAFDAAVATIQESLASGNKVVVMGWGTFLVKEVAERIMPVSAVNPNGPRFVPAHNRVMFKPGKRLADSVR